MFGIGRDEWPEPPIRIVSGVLADECAARLRTFFAGLRERAR